MRLARAVADAVLLFVKTSPDGSVSDNQHAFERQPQSIAGVDRVEHADGLAVVGRHPSPSLDLKRYSISTARARKRASISRLVWTRSR